MTTLYGRVAGFGFSWVSLAFIVGCSRDVRQVEGLTMTDRALGGGINEFACNLSRGCLGCEAT